MKIKLAENRNNFSFSPGVYFLCKIMRRPSMYAQYAYYAFY